MSNQPDSQGCPDRKQVDVRSLKAGQVRHESLSPEVLARIRYLHETFHDVDAISLDERCDGFRRDVDPNRELAVWERMARIYRVFCHAHTVSPELRKEAYSVLLMRSMTSEEEVRDRLPIECLSADQVEDLLAGFRGDAHGHP